MSDDTGMKEVSLFLEKFSECVRNRDYDGGKELFCEDVYSFGTVAETVEGLDHLVEKQWKEVWPNTEGFRFETPSARVMGGGEGSGVCVCVNWFSNGISPNGETFPRRGRCTLFLKRVSGELNVWDSHFSLVS